jgi:hypothetical protein
MAELQESLEVLACELGVRPTGAPTMADIAPALRDVERTASALVLTFDPSATPDVEGFVSAEQRCCSSIDWSVERSAGATRMRVAATRQQLDVLELLFAKGS